MVAVFDARQNKSCVQVFFHLKKTGLLCMASLAVVACKNCSFQTQMVREQI